MIKETAVLYPVAGLSTRFGGKVKSLSKVGPNGESLIEYSLNQAINAGFSKIEIIRIPWRFFPTSYVKYVLQEKK